MAKLLTTACEVFAKVVVTGVIVMLLITLLCIFLTAVVAL